jgi:hypothetical protein
VKLAALITVFIALFTSKVSAQTEVPSPQPPCWPSQVYGTGSPAVMWPQAEVGTVIGWYCLVDGRWKDVGLFHPWMNPVKLVPGGITLTLKSYLASIWDANVRERAKTESEQALADRAWTYIATKKPADPPAVTYVVAPVSTGVRPTYAINADGKTLTADGKFIPVATNGQSTSCDCGTAKLAIGAVTYCAVSSAPNPRVTSCRPK